MDTRTPGYRELLLHPDGRLETVVRRLADYPEPFSPDNSGY
jgi:Icc protein